MRYKKANAVQRYISHNSGKFDQPMLALTDESNMSALGNDFGLFDDLIQTMVNEGDLDWHIEQPLELSRGIMNRHNAAVAAQSMHSESVNQGIRADSAVQGDYDMASASASTVQGSEDCYGSEHDLTENTYVKCRCGGFSGLNGDPFDLCPWCNAAPVFGSGSKDVVDAGSAHMLLPDAAVDLSHSQEEQIATDMSLYPDETGADAFRLQMLEAISRSGDNGKDIHRQDAFNGTLEKPCVLSERMLKLQERVRRLQRQIETQSAEIERAREAGAAAGLPMPLTVQDTINEMIMNTRRLDSLKEMLHDEMQGGTSEAGEVFQSPAIDVTGNELNLKRVALMTPSRAKPPVILLSDDEEVEGRCDKRLRVSGSTCTHVQVASQLIDVDGTAAMPMSGGGAVIGSTPRGAQVRAEGCCLAKGSV